MSTDFSFRKGTTAVRAVDFVAFVGDRDTEQVLKSYVLEHAMPHTHVTIGSIDDVIAYLSKIQRSPLFLLIDLHGSAMPLSDLGRLAEVCEPSVQVVAIGERNDVGLFRNLLKLGVRDYLVKPLTVELLNRTLSVSEQKVNPVAQTRAGKTIALVGSRGGVGVTTIALNLALHLADDTHRRIAYVDLNLHGGAANSMLDIHCNNGLIDLLQNVHRLDPQYLERTLVGKGSRLCVLSSELDYGATSPFEPGALKRVLEALRDNFHYVILDVSKHAHPLSSEAFDNTSRVYVVADRSVHSVRESLRLLRYIEDRDNNPTASLLLNSPNAATAGKVRPADFVTAVGRPVLFEIPYEAKAVSIAENLGEAHFWKSANDFRQAIVRIGSDLTGQRWDAERPLLERLGIRRR
ncbi:AAA family ATPase [Paraburkholderia sp. SARCC-3016]|uniref:AAA family ATPase n=1 Tax=Paraburkholderia sp. SARCC-3016 TaxID=3058611 RepID=UPI002807CBA2|nr:AAA family ATPase [Paraburkholderia sp. SARCC-3016]MDQ7981729.1 AAA family ATPase [Paraburkholderia sp. SARCC-3016]